MYMLTCAHMRTYILQPARYAFITYIYYIYIYICIYSFMHICVLISCRTPCVTCTMFVCDSWTPQDICVLYRIHVNIHNICM